MKVGLIKGRHAVPAEVKDYIFEHDIPQDHVTDAEYMYDIAKHFIWWHNAPSELEIYVTGFTPALCAVLKVCKDYACKGYNISVSCWHYDREGKTFWKQEVL